jgi:hypothetical protein
MLVLENVARNDDRLRRERSSCRAAIYSGEPLMAKWIGAAILAVTLMFGGAAIGTARAEPLPAAQQISLQNQHTDDFSARRRIRRHHRYVDRPYDRPYYPTYYDRPSYYAPAPFFPLLGLGYGPWW